jgi:excisionase family DNA binding protein
MDLAPYMTVEQMAKYLQIGRTAAYELARRDGFPAVRFGRTIRIPREGLLLWLSRQEGQPSAG